MSLSDLLNLDQNQIIEPRLLLWSAAFDSWLAERRAFSDPTVAAYSLNAWREFLALTRRPPWQATAADVAAYVESLEKRKLRPGTISNRLARLSKFYEYCQTHAIDPQCEAGFNPVAAVSRPARRRYAQANYLTSSEEAALLAAIRRDPSPLGQRDYALFLLLLRTGWKAGAVRNLKWGDLGAGNVSLPEEVLTAIHQYLDASGRLPGILPGDYLFAPSRQALIREAGDRCEDWDASRPLSAGDLLFLLKSHARRAGLKAGKINCHTLRHTAIMRQVESGASLESIGAMLGMERADLVKDYLKRMAKKPKGRLRARKRLDPATGELVPPGSDEVPSRGPQRAGRRNHLALTHGFYARYLPEFEWLAEEGKEPPHGMDRAILRWRIVMRRILIVGYDVDNLKDAMRYLRLTCLSAHRLCKALKFQREMRELQMHLRWVDFFRQRGSKIP